MKLNYIFLIKNMIKNIQFFIINIYGDTLVYLNNNNIFIYTILFFKKNTLLQISQFLDICVIDYPFNQKRFVLLYNFISIFYNKRYLYKLFLKENSFINSIESVFIGSNWSEREIWDMFGIFFIENKNLRRILTDYGFEGYPLRKDFPLTGYLELYYDESLLSLKYVPIELSQDFRIFYFLSPWEFNKNKFI